MRFLTDRKRAMGLGSSHGGTEHHWSMQVSSAGLAILVPFWVFVFGSALGGSHAEVIETFGRPFPAILTALILVVGMQHFSGGVRNLIDDYTDGTARMVLIIAAKSLSFAVMATGLYALVRIAL